MARYKDKPQKSKPKADPRFDPTPKRDRVKMSPRKPNKRFFWVIGVSAGMFVLILEAVILLTMKDEEPAIISGVSDYSNPSSQHIIVVDGTVTSEGELPGSLPEESETASPGTDSMAGEETPSGGSSSMDMSSGPVSSDDVVWIPGHKSSRPESAASTPSSAVSSPGSRPESNPASSGSGDVSRPDTSEGTSSSVSTSSSGSAVEKRISLSAELSELTLAVEQPYILSLRMDPPGCAISFSGDTAGFSLRQDGDMVIITPNSNCKKESTLLLTARKSGYAPAELSLAITVNKPLDNGEVLSLTDKLYIAINNARMDAGVSPLTRFSELDAGAQKRAAEASEKFSSTRPNGNEFYTVYTPGPNYNYAENLMKGCSTAEEAFAAWMASPGHRDNMLDENYTGLGLGVYRDAYGKWFWVEHFYRP